MINRFFPAHAGIGKDSEYENKLSGDRKIAEIKDLNFQMQLFLENHRFGMMNIGDNIPGLTF